MACRLFADANPFNVGCTIQQKDFYDIIEESFNSTLTTWLLQLRHG